MARAEPVPLGAEQCEPEQNERAGVAGRHARGRHMPGEVGGRRRIAEQYPVDAKVKSVKVLEDGCAAEQDERETDEPGEGSQAAECQAEEPDAGGDGTCSSIRRHAVQAGEERLERGEIEMPAGEYQRPGGANHQGTQAGQSPRHPYGAGHRQCHPHWDLNHSRSSPQYRGIEARAKLGAPRQKALEIGSNERVLQPFLRCYSLAKVEPIGHADGLALDCCEMSPKRRRKYGREQEPSSQSTGCNLDAHGIQFLRSHRGGRRPAIGARRPSARAGISGSARSACRFPWSRRSPWSRRPRRLPISSLA